MLSPAAAHVSYSIPQISSYLPGSAETTTAEIRDVACGRREHAVDVWGGFWRCQLEQGQLHRQGHTRTVSPSLAREMISNFSSCIVPQRSKMLKPEKWQASFDSEGKVLGFSKALKLIVLGGVDPSIRAEVWEFLLGCYALSSTTENRNQLRIARKERYDHLIKQCQMMHSSIGTGTLAYAVGSKVMDMRTASKETVIRESVRNCPASDHSNKALVLNSGTSTDYEARSYMQPTESLSVSEIISARMSTENAVFNSSFPEASSSGRYHCLSRRPGDYEVEESQYLTESYFDFPPLPVTNLFQTGENDAKGLTMHEFGSYSAEYSAKYEKENMHSFQISNNVDLLMETNESPICVPHDSVSDTEFVSSEIRKHENGSKRMKYKNEVVSRVRISDVPVLEAGMINEITPDPPNVNEDRVSEWLWTLHRIVVDVVRTDNHLEFYGDPKNMARMSDILAVYAWVDPATGYCQGMSDLLSPFVVLYEDNADAFWCFEMLLRRMRENFQMEGPTGVMKQLQALWKILELTDSEIYDHLLNIGAESLHFAFRMLLVLFRRELSFNEALCMWEMMWAADFDEAMGQQFEENCLEPLVLHIQDTSNAEVKGESTDNDKTSSNGLEYQHGKYESCASYNNGIKSVSSNPLCGLARANFWPRHNELQVDSGTIMSKRGDDEMPVYCVAAILIINRHKIMRRAHSIDDMIKIFNDNMLKINVKRCIRLGIKLRKKYIYKSFKQANLGSSDLHGELM